ncbi:MAG: hypothetical protein AB7D57_14235 [Desulfovibrionaceae bacterium]
MAQRSLIHHLGILAGLTGLVFFGFGLVGLLQGDPGLTAVVDGYGPGARSRALALLAGDTAASLAVTAGCVWFRRGPGPWLAAAGLTVLALTLAAGAADSLTGGQGAAAVLTLAAPAAACLVLAAGLLRRRRADRAGRTGA